MYGYAYVTVALYTLFSHCPFILYSLIKATRSCVKLFKEQLLYALRKPRNTRLLDNNLERRPITIELNLNAVTLCGGESLPVSSLTFDP